MKDVSLMHGYENGKHEGYGMKGGFFVVCFLLFKRLRRMFSFLLFLWGIDKEKRRQVWMEMETCGESRKVVKSVLIFIYTPVISLSLASKFSKPDTQRIELPYSLSLYPLPLLPFGAVFVLYFVHPTHLPCLTTKRPHCHSRIHRWQTISGDKGGDKGSDNLTKTPPPMERLSRDSKRKLLVCFLFNFKKDALGGFPVFLLTHSMSFWFFHFLS